MSGFTAIVVARIEVLLDRPEQKKDKNSLNKKSILKYFFELFRKKGQKSLLSERQKLQCFFSNF